MKWQINAQREWQKNIKQIFQYHLAKQRWSQTKALRGEVLAISVPTKDKINRIYTPAFVSLLFLVIIYLTLLIRIWTEKEKIQISTPDLLVAVKHHKVVCQTKRKRRGCVRSKSSNINFFWTAIVTVELVLTTTTWTQLQKSWVLTTIKRYMFQIPDLP